MRDADQAVAASVERALLMRDGKLHRGDREIRFACPIHDDRHPSADYSRADGVWVCRSCGAKGGLTWGDHPLAPLVGVHAETAPPVDMAEFERQQAKLRAEHEAAESRRRDALATYWRERRLCDELVRHGDVLAKLAREGIRREAVEHFRFGHADYYGTPALAIPWTVRGDVRAVQYRLLADSPGGRYRWHEGSRATLFNADAVLDPHDDTIIVVEGAKKCAALWSHGITSVCATVNKSGWRAEYARPFGAFGRVVFMPDPDAWREAVEAARTVGGRVAYVPGKPDDTLVETGGDVDLLWEYVENARVA